MTKKTIKFYTILATLLVITAQPINATEEVEAGAKVFRACASCHSLEPDQHMTGPSLAGIMEKKSGSIKGFQRYSPALKTSSIVWDHQTLDAWLENPQKLIPNNWMTFKGIQNKQDRINLIAFLQNPKESKIRTQSRPDLKKLEANQQIKYISYCGDTYYITAVSGSSYLFWEYNLRLKSDSSHTGPKLGRPVIVSSGMRGDRASIIFSQPGEISNFIKQKCN